MILKIFPEYDPKTAPEFGPHIAFGYDPHNSRRVWSSKFYPNMILELSLVIRINLIGHDP